VRARARDGKREHGYVVTCGIALECARKNKENEWSFRSIFGSIYSI